MPGREFSDSSTGLNLCNITRISTDNEKVKGFLAEGTVGPCGGLNVHNQFTNKTILEINEKF